MQDRCEPPLLQPASEPVSAVLYTPSTVSTSGGGAYPTVQSTCSTSVQYPVTDGVDDFIARWQQEAEERQACLQQAAQERDKYWQQVAEERKEFWQQVTQKCFAWYRAAAQEHDQQQAPDCFDATQEQICTGQLQQSESHNQQPRDHSQSTHTQPRHRSRTPGFHGRRQSSQPRTTALEPSTSQSADVNSLIIGSLVVNVPAAPPELWNVTVTTQNGMQPTVKALPDTDSNTSAIPEQMVNSFGSSVRDIPTVQSCPQTATGTKIPTIGTLPVKVTLGLHETEADTFTLRDLTTPILSQHILKTLKLLPSNFPFEHISDAKVSMTESLPSLLTFGHGPEFDAILLASGYDPEFDASAYTFPFDPGSQVFIHTSAANHCTHKVNRNLKTNCSIMFKDDVTIIPDSVDKQPPDRPKRSSKPPQRLDL